MKDDKKLEAQLLTEIVQKAVQKATSEAAEEAFQAGFGLGHMQGLQEGYILGVQEATQRFAPAISDGVRHRSSECGKALQSLKNQTSEQVISE